MTDLGSVCYNKAAIYNTNASGFLTTCFFFFLPKIPTKVFKG